MSAHDIFKLTTAPVVGQHYRVPTVLWSFKGLETDWPVMTPAPHVDVELAYNGRTERIYDWHLDYRFMTPAQVAHLVATEPALGVCGPLIGRWPGERVARQFTLLSAPVEERVYPLHRYPSSWPSGERFPEAVFSTRICIRPTIAPLPLLRPFDLSHFGTPAPAIVTPTGRVLCPHQKMDLTHWPREADGSVICPLHRLRVGVPA